MLKIRFGLMITGMQANTAAPRYLKSKMLDPLQNVKDYLIKSEFLMKTKLTISAGEYNLEQWTDLPFVPRIDDWFNLQDILNLDEIAKISASSNKGTIVKGQVKAVEYRHDDNDFYTEIYIFI